MIKRWRTLAPPAGDNREITAGFGELVGGLLLRRGITDMKSAEAFFGCGALSDPMELRDMDRAVEVIRAALDGGEKITVFGDYDCDGVTSTAMLCGYLEAMGADVDFYIPDRSEGYGLNLEAAGKILDSGTELIITVDNGISAYEEAKYITDRGAKLVITDHHQPSDELPVCDACVDPHRADDISAFKDLCGAGVVLKLLCALEEDEEFILEQYSDLAAVGTIGDVVPLKGENRFIVQRGMENIRNSQNMGLDKLIRAAGVAPESISASQIAFSVCPRLNAAGRVAQRGAEKAAELLSTESSETAARLSEELSLLNDSRRQTENDILSEINEQIARNPKILNDRVIMVAGEGWQHGVIGLAASRLTDRYGKPALVIGIEGESAVGSARSIGGFNMFRMLSGCSEPLTKFGGHPMAGGFSLPAERIEEFRELVGAYCLKNYPKMPEDCICADMEINLGELTLENAELLERLEPFGEGNHRPLFLIRGCTVASKQALSGGKYTCFYAEQEGAKLKALCFSHPFESFYPNAGDKLDIIASAEINEYKGNRSVELKIKDFRFPDFSEDKFFAASRVYEEISRGEGCDKRLAPRVIPQDRAELMKVYDLVKRCGGAVSAEEMALRGCGINYCMLRITLDAFAEAGMIELSPAAQSAVIKPSAGKKDLFGEGLLFKLKKELEEKTTV